MVRGVNKKGQVTIFVIIALIIIVVGIAIYFLFPQIISDTFVAEENPREYIRNCLQEPLEENIGILSLQGGSINPELGTYRYKGEDDEPHDIEYLCYTNKYYEQCVVQQPFLIAHIEEELRKNLESKIETCFDSMKKNYEENGYSVNLKKGDFSIDLLPKKILLRMNNSLALTKDSSQTYESFNVVLNNNLYELISLANNIIKWEYTYGESSPETYMNLYLNFKVEKKKQSDGTKIYIITERDTKNKFQFASRSRVLPPGITQP